MAWVRGTLAGLLLSGCGGGGEEAPTLMDLVSEGFREGSISAAGPVSLPSGQSFTGDMDGDAPGVTGRQCFSFDLTPLLAGREILSAALLLHQREVFGSPYLSHGPLLADHVDYGDTLDAADYDTPALEAVSPTLATNATTGIKSADVTEALRSDLAAGRTRAQFRLRFALRDGDHDAENDCALMADAANSATGIDHVPVLHVRLAPPPH